MSLSSIKGTLERVDRLIVHQSDEAQVLADMGLSENVTVVPLGASAPPAVSSTQARTALGSERDQSSGRSDSSYPTRDPRTRAGRRCLREEFPDICLLALCARYPDVRSDEYEAEVRAEIDRQGLGETSC